MLFEFFWLIFLISPFWGCRWRKEGRGFSPENQLPWRGFLCWLVAFGHLSGSYKFDQKSSLYVADSSSFLINLFSLNIHNLGYLAVAVFLLFSGYGCAKSYLKTSNPQHYRDVFLKRRFLKLLPPFILCNILFIICFSIQVQKFSLMDALCSFVDLRYNPVFWYVIVAFLLYIVFYCSISMAANSEETRKGGGIACAVVVYAIFLFFRFHFPLEHWYVSLIGWIIGIAYAYFEEQMRPIIHKYNWLLLIIFGGIAFYISSYAQLKQLTGYIVSFLENGPVMRISACAFLCFFFIILFEMVDFTHCILYQLSGRYSYIIYLIHPLLLNPALAGVGDFTFDSMHYFIAILILILLVLISTYILERLNRMTIKLFFKIIGGDKHEKVSNYI